MSYILEALKKAQAERQLGHAPDIHAAPLHAGVPAQQRTARTRLWLAAGAAAVIALAAAAWWLRPAGQGAPGVLAANSATPHVAPPATAPAAAPPAPAQAIAPAPALPATAVAQAAPTSPLPAGAAPTAALAATAATQTAASFSAQPPAATAPAPTQSSAGRTPAPSSAVVPSLASAASLPAAAPRAASAAPAAAAPAQAPAVRDPDDTLPTARELPESLRQSLPQVTLGGYIYATNPADRLVLIDKTLRHEGEEIAPGLTLERLQPRYAVLNFRGTRYRVAY